MNKNLLARSAFLAVTTVALTVGAAVPSVFAQAAPVVSSLSGPCGTTMQYEEDCIRAVRRAITSSAAFSDADKELVYARIREVSVQHAFLKSQIDRILTTANIPLEAGAAPAADAAAPAATPAATPAAPATPAP